MPDLTVVIPVADYHQEIAQRAIDSVRAQTIPCQLKVFLDSGAKGAGYARNRALMEVETSHVAFLDADDTIDPRFAQICLEALEGYASSGRADPRYAYTDWLGLQNIAIQAPEPCEAWTNQTAHLVTTALPTERVRLIGGFDEVMTGLEDTDFYVRLRLSGVCGLHVNAPLVHYREGGQRSVTARATGQEALVQQYMTNRYGRYPLMGCCGDPTPAPTGPDNEPMEGDILVQAAWSGNRRETGRVTGRLYPRTSFPKMLYVNEADVNASPMLWRRMNTPVQASNGVILQPQYQAQGVDSWQDVASALFGGGSVQAQASGPVEYKPKSAGRKKADVLAKAQEPTSEWTHVEGDLE
jgi:hypothetical protein